MDPYDIICLLDYNPDGKLNQNHDKITEYFLQKPIFISNILNNYISRLGSELSKKELNPDPQHGFPDSGVYIYLSNIFRSEILSWNIYCGDQPYVILWKKSGQFIQQGRKTRQRPAIRGKTPGT